MMMMMMMMMMVFINDDDLVALFGVKKEQQRERFPVSFTKSRRSVSAPLSRARAGTQRVVVVVFFVHQNTFFRQKSRRLSLLTPNTFGSRSPTPLDSNFSQ